MEPTTPPTSGLGLVPPAHAGGRPQNTPYLIPGSVPLPPLVAHEHDDRCGGEGSPHCWSLAPWRSRTAVAPYAAAVQTGAPATPRWAFAPPSVKAGSPSPSGAPGAVPYAAGRPIAAGDPASGRAACWVFNPAAHCVRSD